MKDVEGLGGGLVWCVIASLSAPPEVDHVKPHSVNTFSPHTHYIPLRDV